MSDIIWGDEIAVDGKRPEWLKDNDEVRVRECGLPMYDLPVRARGVEWHDELEAIRLPADHPHYAELPGNSGQLDWSKPIEAVHEDGRVVPVERFGGLNGRNVMPTLEGGWFAFEDDGSHNYPFCPWRIRNVTQAPETGSTAPSPSEVGPEVLERMIALVKAVAQCTWADAGQEHGIGSIPIKEARAIVVLLPEPVDADEQYARHLIREQGWQDEREIGSEAVVRMIAMARRAHALEKEAGR